MSKVKRVGRAFSSLPFDGIDNVANVSLHDDFITATSLADIAADTALQSELVWNADELVVSAGPHLITAIDAVANHPGIINLQTAGAAGDAISLALGGGVDAENDQGVLLDDNGVYVASLVRINDIDGVNFQFGLAEDLAVPNSGSNNLVVFAYEEADTAGQFLAQVNTTSDTEEAFTIGYVQADWVLLEIYATDEDAYFRLTSEDATETVHLNPTMPAVDMRPNFVVEDVGGSGGDVDIDAFHLRYQRQPRVGGGNTDVAWLGQ